jgi:hypothetical protein
MAGGGEAAAERTQGDDSSTAAPPTSARLVQTGSSARVLAAYPSYQGSESRLAYSGSATPYSVFFGDAMGQPRGWWEVEGKRGLVTCLAGYQLPDGRGCVASGHAEGAIILWDGDAKDVMNRFRAHAKSQVTCLYAYQEPGKGQPRLASGGEGRYCFVSRWI